jgi:hypothetical protein
VKVDGGDRIASHPLDPVDVGPSVGDPAGDRGHRGGPQRGADDRDIRATLPAGLVVADAPVQVDGHVEARGSLLDGRAHLLAVAR